MRFAPCARTAWHCHAVGQTLHVTDGIGLVQSRGGKVIEIRPSDTIYTPPGEWHWHGAAPEHFMTHLAMWEVDEQGNSATWVRSSAMRSTAAMDRAVLFVPPFFVVTQGFEEWLKRRRKRLAEKIVS